MDYFTTRNAVIVALVQTGVIVAGVLGAGAVCKWYASTGSLGPPAMTAFASEYGYRALVIPPAWAAAALWALRHEDDEGGPRVLTFLTGLFIILVLLVLAFQVAALPLLRLLSPWTLGS